MTPITALPQSAPDNSTGCDCNVPVTEHLAQSIKDTGRIFVVRYIPRGAGTNKGGDLSNAEAHTILNSGLALMVVQHVANEGWSPDEALGTSYGSYAASYCKEVGLPSGVNVWLDLEGVNPNAAKYDVISYCNAWYNEVNAAGYVPGIYIGWQVIINNQDAYNLPFAHYWAAYNADVVPAIRGYQLKQGLQIKIGGVMVDPDTIHLDGKGGVPIWLKS